ncbi:MAG: non-ribosomal peptide synthetase [Pseudonocardiaceae bacterium]
MSTAEKRMWVLQQLRPESTQYVLTWVLRLSGRVSREALRGALNLIVTRHPTLRSGYHCTPDGTMRASVYADSTVPVIESDLRLLPERARAEAIRDAGRVERSTPFDLTSGILLSARLLRVTDEEYVLVLSAHHIAFDSFSTGILLRELALAYPALVRGEQPALAPLLRTYQDFVTGVDAVRAVGPDGVTWWRDQLAGAPVLLDVPGDLLPGSADHAPRAGTETCMLPAATVRGLRALCREHDCPLHIGMLTGFAALLHRLTGQPELLVGMPVSTRSRAAYQQVIGLFVNTVAVRANFADNPDFSSALDRVGAAARAGLRHREIAFDEVVRTVNPPRAVDREPLCQVLFDAQQPTPMPAAFGDLRVTALDGDELALTTIEVSSTEAKFDLTLTVEDRRADEVRVVLEYRCDRYSSRWASGFLARLYRLLAAWVADPSAAVSAPPLHADGDEHPGPSIRHGPPLTIPRITMDGLVARHAESSPDTVAIIDADEQLSYRDLLVRADRLAAGLHAHGVAPGGTVALLVPRSVRLVVLFLAVLRAGGAALVLDDRHPPARWRTAIDQARARLLVSTAALSPNVPNLGAPVRTEQDLELPPSAAAAHHADVTDVDRNAYVVFTSGSTGDPKGVAVTHRALVNAYYGWERTYRLPEIRSHLQMAGPAFDVFVGDLTRALCSGATLVICPQETLLDPAALHAALRDHQIEFAEFVPCVLDPLLDHLDRLDTTLDSIRGVVVGSETWTVRSHHRLRRRVPGAFLVGDSYGVAEATIDSSVFLGDVAHLAPHDPVPLGTPLPNVSLYVLDEQRHPLPAGTPGELWVGGAGVATGYLAATTEAERFHPDPSRNEPGALMYRTGDRARLDTAGNLVLLGRVDRQIKVRGQRVEPAEVEAALAACPGVRRAIVVPRHHQGDTALSAFVVPEPEARIDPGLLHAALGRRLPDAACPSAYAVLDAFPLTRSGKVDVAALPVTALRPAAGDGQPRAPRTPLERELATVCAEVLTVDHHDLGADRDFFALGGNSLSAGRIAVRIRETFGVAVSIRSVFDHPTVAELAAIVAAAPVVTVTSLGRRRQTATVRIEVGGAITIPQDPTSHPTGEEHG